MALSTKLDLEDMRSVIGAYSGQWASRRSAGALGASALWDQSTPNSHFCTNVCAGALRLRRKDCFRVQNASLIASTNKRRSARDRRDRNRDSDGNEGAADRLSMRKRSALHSGRLAGHGVKPVVTLVAQLASPLVAAFAGGFLGCLVTLEPIEIGVMSSLASASTTAVLCGLFLITRTARCLSGAFFPALYGGTFGGMTSVAPLINIIPAHSVTLTVGLFRHTVHCLWSCFSRRYQG
jgi:hypothetical protein